MFMRYYWGHGVGHVYSHRRDNDANRNQQCTTSPRPPFEPNGDDHDGCNSRIGLEINDLEGEEDWDDDSGGSEEEMLGDDYDWEGVPEMEDMYGSHWLGGSIDDYE
jgi:hypothetical protein